MAAQPPAPVETIFRSISRRQNKTKDLLRFTTAGSVDDGKSTLIGRLLYDSRSVYEDQLESVTKASAGRNAGAIDFSLLTDGLRAEREQGITIDVAYRYFATPKRKFIIADTPGHEQYTRNMVTGASTAELAIVLVDARKGVLRTIAPARLHRRLLGIPHLVVAVNKMDLVGYERRRFRQIETDFRKILARFPAIEPYFVPDQRARRRQHRQRAAATCPGSKGQSLLEHLETVPVGGRVRARRVSLSGAARRASRSRNFAAMPERSLRVTVRPGDPVVVLPSGRETTIARIVTFDGDLDQAEAGKSVTLTLADEIDMIRGDVIARATKRRRKHTLSKPRSCG